MKDWIKELIAVVLIVMIFSLITPDGKIKKNIKTCLSLLIIIVMIKPLISIKNINFSDIFNFDNSEIVYQENFLDYVKENKIEYYENLCKQTLSQNGIENAQIKIEYVVNEKSEIKIKNIDVNLKNSVISKDKEHIDITEQVKKILSETFNLEKGDINVYVK